MESAAAPEGNPAGDGPRVSAPPGPFPARSDQLKGVLIAMVRAGQVLDKVALIADGSAALGDFARELVGSAIRQRFLNPGR